MNWMNWFVWFVSNFLQYGTSGRCGRQRRLPGLLPRPDQDRRSCKRRSTGIAQVGRRFSIYISGAVDQRSCPSLTSLQGFSRIFQDSLKDSCHCRDSLKDSLQDFWKLKDSFKDFCYFGDAWQDSLKDSLHDSKIPPRILWKILHFQGIFSQFISCQRRYESIFLFFCISVLFLWHATSWTPIHPERIGHPHRLSSFRKVHGSPRESLRGWWLPSAWPESSSWPLQFFYSQK